MSQLTQVASVSRKVIKYGSLALIMMMVVRSMFGLAYRWWKLAHPDPPPPPDVKFGKLPVLKFPQQTLSSKEFQYSLETPTGGLPTKLPNQYAVYFMPIKKPSLLAYDEAKNLARQLDLIGQPFKLSESRYRWTGRIANLPTQLTMNIITGEFKFEKRWRVDNSFLIPSLVISKDQAVQLVKNQLSRLNLLADDLNEGKSLVNYWKIQGNNLVPAVALSKAQFLEVNLFRSPIKETPVLTTKPEKGLVRALIGLQKNEKKQIVELEYKYFPVARSQKATYPLIGIQKAWQKLQQGNAFVALKPLNKTKAVAISKIYLGYYDAETPQEFLQPIYVFQGKNFIAYVPAVADEWVSR